MASDKPANKAELLRFQRDGRERWEALLAHVPAERTAEPGVKGDRSVKDIVAHLAAWERHATEIVAYNGYLHYLDFAVGLRRWLWQILGVIPPT